MTAPAQLRLEIIPIGNTSIDKLHCCPPVFKANMAIPEPEVVPEILQFILPTETEWDEERLSWGSNDSNGAYNSPLKLTVAGYRYQNGGIYQVGLKGNYWSSTFNGTNSRYLNTESGNAIIYDGARANGASVRCIED